MKPCMPMHSGWRWSQNGTHWCRKECMGFRGSPVDGPHPSILTTSIRFASNLADPTTVSF
jgi:hypothetical protein